MSGVRRDLRLALRVARREMRTGLTGFGVFSVCLFLGVFAISAVGSFSEAARRGLVGDARALLGGDVEVRLTHRPATAEQLEVLERYGTVSTVVESRVMVSGSTEAPAAGSVPSVDRRPVLAELKAVDALYPLYGVLRLSPSLPPASVLSRDAGSYGVAVEPLLLERLGLAVGDFLRVGDAVLQVRARIESEPDRAVRLFSFGPRVLLSREALGATALGGPGSLVRYRYRVALGPETTADELVDALEARFPDTGWRIRTFAEAAPRIQRLLDRMTTQFTLVALCTLLVGGLGIAGGVRGYLSGKLRHIAVMKCVGASRRLVFFAFLGQILAIGAVASLLGTLAASGLPLLAVSIWGDGFPVPLRPGLYPGPLLTGGLFGLLVSLVFSYRALRAATLVPPAGLFRGDRTVALRTEDSIAWSELLRLAAGAALLGAAALLTARDVRLTLWFLVATLGAFGAFQFLGAALAFGARRVPDLPLRSLRLGISNVRRPHSVARSAVLSLGIGLTALTSIALIEANLADLVRESLPDQAPSFFFLEILDHQVEAFEGVLGETPGVGQVRRYPTLRGRITRIDGVPVEERTVDPGVEWAVRGDRFLSSAERAPDPEQVVAGTWWAPDYDGIPLLSLTADLAEGFGVSVGDTLTLNVLGREVTARIANLREVDWSTLQLNFAVILSPGVLEDAPVTYLAAAYVPQDREAALLRRLTSELPNVTAVHVREVLQRVAQVIGRIGAVFRGLALVALATGLLVLAGALSAEQHQRLADAIIYKVCGATRRDVLAVLAAEFLLVGTTTALVSCLAGTLAAQAVVEHLLELEFRFHGAAVGITAAVGVLLTTAGGLLGTARILGKSPAAHLRNP